VLLEGKGFAGQGTMTRLLTIVGALAASTLLGGWAFDRQGPYCHFDRDFTNCGYPSLAACVEAARGVGGNCQPNPQYFPDQPRRRKYR
jgi:hypothetical protein